MDVENFVKNLKAILKERGISPSRAGRESGAGIDFIRMMEVRKSAPSYLRVQQMAQYLGMTTSELLGEETPASGAAGGLDPEQAELIRLYDRAAPEVQAAMLAMLRAAEAQRKAQGSGGEGK